MTRLDLIQSMLEDWLTALDRLEADAGEGRAPTRLEAYREALAAVRQAEIKAHAAMRRAMPLGSLVTYRHGDHTRQATVLDHTDDGVRVRGVTLAEYWLHAPRVVEVEAP